MAYKQRLGVPWTPGPPEPHLQALRRQLRSAETLLGRPGVDRDSLAAVLQGLRVRVASDLGYLYRDAKERERADLKQRGRKAGRSP